MKLKDAGMTLIEVMVALAIMSFLAIFTGTSIRNALSSKMRIQNNIDLQATLRDALKVMERDINLAFQFRDPNLTLYNQAVKERERRLQQPQKPGETTNQQPTAPQARAAGYESIPQAEALEMKPIQILTQFVGEKEQISFTSMSNVRMRADDKTSSIAEIGYFLKNCRRRTSQEKSSRCLWRRVSPIIGTDVTKGGTETVLLENVESFELRYLGPGREEEWVDFWATNERGDDTTRFKFPYAVEITIEISDPAAEKLQNQRKKTLRMTHVAAIRNPGNLKNQRPDGSTADPNQQNQTGQPQTNFPPNPGGSFNQ